MPLSSSVVPVWSLRELWCISESAVLFSNLAAVCSLIWIGGIRVMTNLYTTVPSLCSSCFLERLFVPV